MIRTLEQPRSEYYLVLVCGALACGPPPRSSSSPLAGFSMDILVGASKHMQSAGDWEKGEKEALLVLERYAAKTGSEADFQASHSALRVPLAFQEIRLQLTRRANNPEARRRAMITAGIPPENWTRLTRRYRVFGGETHVAQAMHWWTEGDRGIDELQTLAERLHVKLPHRSATKPPSSELSLSTLTTPPPAFAQSVSEATLWITPSVHHGLCADRGLSAVGRMGHLYTPLSEDRGLRAEVSPHLIDTAGEAIFILDGRTAAISMPIAKVSRYWAVRWQQFTGTIISDAEEMLPRCCLCSYWRAAKTARYPPPRSPN